MVRATSHTRETRTAVFERAADGMLHSRTKIDAVEGVSEAQENLDAIAALCGDELLPMLCDITGLKAQDRDARDLYSSTELTTAVALVVHSPLARVIASFYLGLNRPLVPTRVFTSERAAHDWLKNYPPRPRS